MSGCAPDSSDRDQLSFGSGRQRWSPGPGGLVMLVAGLVLGALVGFTFASSTGGESPRGQEPTTVTNTLAAGFVADPDASEEDGPTFTLPLRNSGDELVTTKAISFGDVQGELRAVEEASLTPGSWVEVEFAAPTDCSSKIPLHIDAVTVVASTADGEEIEQEIQLAGVGDSILGYHRAVCAPQIMPGPRDLAGAWVVHRAFGAQDSVGSMVWRFGPRRTFDADPEGLVGHDVGQGVEGRYSLVDDEMRIHVEGGYGCDSGDVAVWRPSLMQRPATLAPTEVPTMSVTWLEGTCPDGMQGQIWILRRVLDPQPSR